MAPITPPVFPPVIFPSKPLTNVSAFSYRDGETYLQTLERLRRYMNDNLVGELNEYAQTVLDNYETALRDMVARGEQNVTDIIEAYSGTLDEIISQGTTQRAEMQTQYDDFSNTVTELVDDINNRNGAVPVQHVTLTENYTVAFSPLWPKNLVRTWRFTQDAVGGRTVAWPDGVSSIDAEIDPTPFSSTIVTLTPLDANGASWRAISDYSTPVAQAIYNVRDFGAVGDGYADDLFAFQAAHDVALSFGGGTVYMPPGQYWLSGPIMIKSGVNWRGDGEATVIRVRQNVEKSTRTNYVYQPRGATPVTVLTARGWSYSAGTNEDGNTTLIRNASDGPIIPGGQRISSYVRRTVTVPKSDGGSGLQYTSNAGDWNILAGRAWTGSLYVRASQDISVYVGIRARVGNNFGATVGSPHFNLKAGQWTRVYHTALAPSTADGFRVGIYMQSSALMSVNGTIDVTGAMVEQSSNVSPYTDGDIPSTETVVRYWAGTPNDSASVEEIIPGLLRAPMFVASSYGIPGYGSGASDLTISDFVARGDYANGAVGTLAQLHHSRNVTFRNVVADELMGGGHVVDMMGCDTVLVDGCSVIGSSGDRVYSEAFQTDYSQARGFSWIEDSTYAACDGLPTINVTIQNSLFTNKVVNGVNRPCPSPMGTHTAIEGQRLKGLAFLNNVVRGWATDTTSAYRGVLHFSTGPQGLRIEGNRFENTLNADNPIINVYRGVYLLPMSEIKNPAPPASPQSANALTARNVRILNNTITGSARGDSAITIAGDHTANVLAYDVEVSNNRIENNDQGIYMRMVNDVVITNNTFTYGLRAVFLQNCNDVAVNANSIRDLMMDLADGGGIRFQGVVGGAIVGNNIRNARDPIWVSSLSSNCTVQGNVIAFSPLDGDGRGIIIYSGANHVAITGNTLRALTTSNQGIRVGTADVNRVTIAGNVYSANITEPRSIIAGATNIVNLDG